VSGHEFDPGPISEPLLALVREYPGTEVYPADDFRVEWGPIFHRGRLDGSARVLIMGQDPGQHESIAKRCLVGEAGQRVQGFMAKLGITRSYVAINAFLYSVYGQSAGEHHAGDEPIAAYRNRWLDALLLPSNIDVVMSFGHIAREALDTWRATQPERAAQIVFEPMTHPTMPEASSKGDPVKLAAAMKTMLAQYNEALRRLDAAIGERDVERELTLYGETMTPADRATIPEADLPLGAPAWWSSPKAWAQRVGDTAEEKRATVVVRVPEGERPWE
jgi:Uracil DNA glycosylase superfamily